jgi:hypothetical protein
MKRNAWSDREVQILKEAYPVVGIKGAMKLLEGRSFDAIRTKAQELGVQTSKDARRYLAREASIRANKQIKERKLLEAQKAVSFPEYDQASDIFQVGFRIACKLGVLNKYARKSK